MNKHTATILVGALILMAPNTEASTPGLERPLVIRAIIGEASSEGYRGMLAVACAVRNRKSLKQVYGVKAKHVDKQPAYVWKMAEKAWKESQHNDITKGATGWGNDNDIKIFKKEGWWKNAVITAKIGNHTFYRDRK